MKKQLLLVAFAFTLSLAFTACRPGANQQNETQEEQPAQEEPAAAQPDDTAAPADTTQTPDGQ